MDQEILSSLTGILDWYKSLLLEVKFDKKWNKRLICYYYMKNRYKKLIFYINPSKRGVVFAVDYYGNNILEKIPTLIAIADEQRKSVIKFNIKNLDDIKTKAITKIIELCVGIVI